MPARRPEDCDALFGDHVNAGDLEALLALYEPTCGFVNGDGSVVVGREALRASFTRLLAMRPRIDVKVVKVVPGDGVAMLYSDWRLTATGEDGEPLGRAGHAIEVVRRQPDGTWCFVADDPFGRGRVDV